MSTPAHSAVLLATLLLALAAAGCGGTAAPEHAAEAAPEDAAGDPGRPMPTEAPDAPWPAPPPDPPEPMPSAFRCTGNEPFWGLEIDGASARWSVPGEEAVEERDLSGGLLTLDHLGLTVWRGELEGGALVAFVERRACVDSMSGRESPYTAVLSMPGTELRNGCCGPPDG